MPVRMAHILEWMDAWAPPALAEEWDNPGLLVGDRSREVTRVMTALEITPAVIDEAIEGGAGLIVTHHPLIFGKIGQVSGDTALGRMLLRLIENRVAVFAAHTNLDRARGGTNDLLCQMLGLQNVAQLGEEKGGLGMGRLGDLPQGQSLEELAERVRQLLGLTAVTYVGEGGTLLQQVAVCTGAGADLMEEALRAGADVLLTGDVKHHQARNAEEEGFCLIDGTHFGTEAPIARMMAAYLQSRAAREGQELTVWQARTEEVPLRCRLPEA